MSAQMMLTSSHGDLDMSRGGSSGSCSMVGGSGLGWFMKNSFQYNGKAVGRIYRPKRNWLGGALLPVWIAPWIERFAGVFGCLKLQARTFWPFLHLDRALALNVGETLARWERPN